MGKMPEAQNFLIPPRRYGKVTGVEHIIIKLLKQIDQDVHLHKIISLTNQSRH